MDLIGAALDEDGTLLYPREVAAARAKCDRRALEGQAELRSNVEALASAHQGPGQKPRVGYVAADVERIRREWFRSHDAIDPDEVTGNVGSSREDALRVLAERAHLRAVFSDHLDSSYHTAVALMAQGRMAGHIVGWSPPQEAG
jgi:hypothetical protein